MSRPQVSVVIPAYNRPELLALTLRSLLGQTLEPALFEVIVVDDGSESSSVCNVVARYEKRGLPARAVRLAHNRGRAAARNAGVMESRGDIVVFLDSDMLVLPPFLVNHLAAHSRPGQIITSPLHWIRVWTHIYPELDEQQLGELREAVGRNRPFALRLYHKLLYHGFDPEKVLDGTEKPAQPLALVDENEVATPRTLRLTYIPTWSEPYTGVIYREHGQDLDGFGMPWIALMTGNCSLERTALLEAGLFDERFRTWGFEDYELGYRLHLLGNTFHCIRGVEAAHQNHPVDRTLRARAMIENYARFLTRHPDLPLLLLSLALEDWNRLHLLGVAAWEFELSRACARSSSDLTKSLRLFETLARHNAVRLLVDRLGPGVLEQLSPGLTLDPDTPESLLGTPPAFPMPRRALRQVYLLMQSNLRRVTNPAGDTHANSPNA